MPTGYTEPVTKGATFEEFLWHCVRAMGVAVMQRDEDLSVPVPERYEPHNWHAEELKKAEARLRELDVMASARAAKEAEREHRRLVMESEKYVKAAQQENERYTKVLVKVRLWKPPTPEHEGLKKFMLEQLEMSMRTLSPWPAPKKMTGPEWLAANLQKAREDIAYHQKGHAEEVERTESRNAWLATLRKSVPQPKAKLEPTR